MACEIVSDFDFSYSDGDGLILTPKSAAAKEFAALLWGDVAQVDAGFLPYAAELLLGDGYVVTMDDSAFALYEFWEATNGNRAN